MKRILSMIPKLFTKCFLMSSLISLLLCALFTTTGCAGGGTSGSGGGTGIQLNGLLRLANGPAAPGVTVSAVPVPAAGLRARSNSAVTDKNGAFTVFVDRMQTEDIRLTFEGPSVRGNYVVSKIPGAAAIIKIDLQYDDEQGDVQETSVEYEDDNGNPVHD